MNYEEKWKVERERKAFLALDDGTVFHGVAFGAKKDALGEVVFNTGMSGYQEILTDPSYAGQFVTLTTAEVGNYGINDADTESRALFLSGLVIGDLTLPSNWRSEKSLDEYLAENGVPGIYGVDTRALTLHIREHGNRKSFLCVSASLSEEEAIAKAREWEGLDGQDYAVKVTCEKAYEFSPAEDAEAVENTSTPLRSPRPLREKSPHIVCYDFGVKTNILRSLASWGPRDGRACQDICRRRACAQPGRRVPFQWAGRSRRRHVCDRKHQKVVGFHSQLTNSQLTNS